jgi:hypothetical protein
LASQTTTNYERIDSLLPTATTLLPQDVNDHELTGTSRGHCDRLPTPENIPQVPQSVAEVGEYDSSRIPRTNSSYSIQSQSANTPIHAFVQDTSPDTMGRVLKRRRLDHPIDSMSSQGLEGSESILNPSPSADYDSAPISCSNVAAPVTDVNEENRIRPSNFGSDPGRTVVNFLDCRASDELNVMGFDHNTLLLNFGSDAVVNFLSVKAAHELQGMGFDYNGWPTTIDDPPFPPSGF